MQGRCAWTYAYLCHVYGKRPEWMEASKSCLDFLENYCRNPDAENRLYFTVTGDGKPCGSGAIASPRAFTPWPTQNIMP